MSCIPKFQVKITLVETFPSAQHFVVDVKTEQNDEIFFQIWRRNIVVVRYCTLPMLAK